MLVAEGVVGGRIEGRLGVWACTGDVVVAASLAVDRSTAGIGSAGDSHSWAVLEVVLGDYLVVEEVAAVARIWMVVRWVVPRELWG